MEKVKDNIDDDKDYPQHRMEGIKSMNFNQLIEVHEYRNIYAYINIHTG